MPFSVFCNSAACAIPRARDIATPEYHSICLRQGAQPGAWKAAKRPRWSFTQGMGPKIPTSVGPARSGVLGSFERIVGHLGRSLVMAGAVALRKGWFPQRKRNAYVYTARSVAER